MKLSFLTIIFCLACCRSWAEPVSFSREILPLLSDNCLSCHGQDAGHRKADLRLDTRDGALAVIKPGNVDASELIKRIISNDPEELMPPEKSHKPRLTDAQVSLLKRWIEEGAVWGKHWAFEKPVKAATAGHPIDSLIAGKLAGMQFALSPSAPKHTLIRRLSFDLTGLPPSEDEVTAFINDGSPEAVSTAADRLMASSHFGERMAMWWLDAARYADTDGFQADDERNNWPWRDWVVNAFNANMPFDQFTTEQCAGDLLPNATEDQKLATCFHRNHMTNGEGGRDPEESRVDYVLDRVNTMGATWLGLTLGCTQCHTHKFDPISHADYYSLTAFFNNIDEDGKAGTGANPYLNYQSPTVARAMEEAQRLVDERAPLEKDARAAAKEPFETWLAAQMKTLPPDFKSWSLLHAEALETSEGTILKQSEDGSIIASGPNPRQDDYRVVSAGKLPRITGFRLEVLPDATHTAGKFSRGMSGEFLLTDIKVQVTRSDSSQIQDILVKSAVADFSADKKKNDNYGDIKDTLDDDPRNGWTTKGAAATEAHAAVFALDEPLVLEPNERLVFELRHRSTLGDQNIGKFRLLATDAAGETVASVKASPMEDLAASGAREVAGVDPKLKARLLEQFLQDYEPYQQPKSSLQRAKAQLAALQKSAKGQNVMVMAERKDPRETFVLVRGVWDKHGDKVTPDVPAAIAPWPADAPRSRLGLAQWLVSRENPLTARVTVNHFWQLLFGNGLVRTPDDFGLQSEFPVYPEVLDWLAVDYMENGWDVKRLLKLIVTSNVYQQDSAVSPELLARDPENKLLARGARFRLPSWMLRDAALKSAGLLNPALGGPPVRPYQPSGVWEELFMGRFNYVASEGPAQYRRSLYAFWRRSIAPAFLFDNAQRRSCEVRYTRTNTPLHALTLLNDETYLEASRTLAEIALHEHAAAPLQWLMQRVVSRPPSPKELAVLQREFSRARDYYQAHLDEAEKFLSLGQNAASRNHPIAELAACTVVSSMILNLDETITHE